MDLTLNNFSNFSILGDFLEIFVKNVWMRTKHSKEPVLVCEDSFHS